MQFGRVIGQAVATVKHPTLKGWKLLIVQPLGKEDQADGEPLLMVDHLGATVGMKVIATTDAAQIRELVGTKNSPIRWSVIGLADT